jgi:hypothetical protein
MSLLFNTPRLCRARSLPSFLQLSEDDKEHHLCILMEYRNHGLLSHRSHGRLIKNYPAAQRTSLRLTASSDNLRQELVCFQGSRYNVVSSAVCISRCPGLLPPSSPHVWGFNASAANSPTKVSSKPGQILVAVSTRSRSSVREVLSVPRSSVLAVLWRNQGRSHVHVPCISLGRCSLYLYLSFRCVSSIEVERHASSPSRASKDGSRASPEM